MIRKIRDALIRSRDSGNNFAHFCAVSIYGVYRALQSAKRLWLDPEFRATRVTKLFHPDQMHQTTPQTGINRYPTVFAECADYFTGRENIRILSFGCSTGEEVLTLRGYFPDATIVGADINRRSLRICRKLKLDDKITFIYSSPKKLKETESFDAIFCMAVFQRTPHHIFDAGITDISGIYPFEKFEKQLVFLRELLSDKGLLIVHFTQYSLADSCVSPGFVPYGSSSQKDYRPLPQFDKNGKLLGNVPPFHSIYLKV